MTAPSWAAHPAFSERIAFLAASEFWSREQHAAYQLRSLREILAHAYARVPFYRAAMARAGFVPDDLTSLGDLRRLPIISKKTIQTDPGAFIADTADRRRLLHRTTGGSTGTPMTVWYDEDFLARDKANTEHYMRVFGLDIFSWRSVRLYGDKIRPELAARGVYWTVEDERKLVMSCYHISARTAPAYVAAINTHAPRYIHTRPSSILPLARRILQDRLDSVQVSHIFCDGECLTDGQRDMIERAFQARLVNIYGHTEACTTGHPCAHSNALHYLPQVGILELLDENGREVTNPGGRGELVVTGFNNRIMPLIRYRTGDIGYLGEPTCACGRHYKILSAIEGRLQDYVVDADGEPRPLAPAVFNYNDMDWKGVREFRVIQENPGVLTVLVQAEDELKSDLAAARAILESRLGAIIDGFRVDVVFVDEIPKTRIGKHRYLEQRLDLAHLVSFR